MVLKQRDLLMIALVVALVFVVIKTGILNPNTKGKIDPSKGSAKDGSTATYAANSTEYKNMATNVHNAFANDDIFGSLWFDNDLALAELTSLNNLNDSDLIGVSNAYNSKFGGSENPTLKGLLAGEYISVFSSPAETMRDIVVNRLIALNS